MTREEKKEFISGILDSVEQKMLKNIDKIPEHWDGIELRWLIVDIVKDSVVYTNRKGRRYRDYYNEIITRLL